MNDECRRCRAAIDDFTALDRAAQRAMLAHADGCAECGRALAQARRVNAYVRGLAPIAPPADLLPRLLAAPHQAPRPTAAPRLVVPVIALLALLAVVALRGRAPLDAPSDGAGAPRATIAAPATRVARSAAVALATIPSPATPADAAPDGVVATVDRVAQAQGAVRTIAATAPSEPTSASPTATAAIAPPEPPRADKPRPTAVPSDEPAPSICGSITVRVYMDLAGADGGPCGGCDGQLTPEDVAVGQALGLRLPSFQLAVYMDDDDARRISSEENIVEAGQVVTRTIDVPCDHVGPLVVEIGGDLGPWQPCAASEGTRRRVTMPGDPRVDFALTTACALPTATPASGEETPGDPLVATPTVPPTASAPPPLGGQPPDRATDLP